VTLVCHGASGREGDSQDIPLEGWKPYENVRDVLEEELKPCCDTDRIRTDELGNLIATKNENRKGPSIMLCAHMDEVSLYPR